MGKLWDFFRETVAKSTIFIYYKLKRLEDKSLILSKIIILMFIFRNLKV